jgi:hypothetical protein
MVSSLYHTEQEEVDLKRHLKWRAVVLCAGFMLILTAPPMLAAPLAKTQPTLQFRAATVVAMGLTAGSQAVVFGVVQEPHRYWWALRRFAEVVTVGSDGTVQYESPSAVDRSFWAVVDINTGAVAVGVPPGAELRATSVRPQSFRTNAGGVIEAFVSARESVEILCVRPNVGAWALSNGDGGENDRDGVVNGSTMTYAGAMKPLGGSPAAPATLLPDDIIIAVDPESMTFVSTEIAP